jgi:hypothetical protein
MRIRPEFIYVSAGIVTAAFCAAAYGLFSLSLSIKSVDEILKSQRVKYWLVMRSSVIQGGNAYLSLPFASRASCENAIRQIFSSVNLAPNENRIVGSRCLPSEAAPASTNVSNNW